MPVISLSRAHLRPFFIPASLREMPQRANVNMANVVGPEM